MRLEAYSVSGRQVTSSAFGTVAPAGTGSHGTPATRLGAELHQACTSCGCAVSLQSHLRCGWWWCPNASQ
jgi:hypothetical protein